MVCIVVDEESAGQWDMTRLLHDLGMNQEEAVAWVKARQEGLPFKADWSDGVGHHLDKLWKRSLHGELRSRLPKWRMIAAVLWGYSFAVWMYVTAVQLVEPLSFNWQLAVWLPWLKMGYIGGAALVASIAFAVVWFVLRTDESKNNLEPRHYKYSS
jgi:hypothetical protein